MPTAPPPPEKDAEIKDLARAIREAVDAEINELAANLASTAFGWVFQATMPRLRDTVIPEVFLRKEKT